MRKKIIGFFLWLSLSLGPLTGAAIDLCKTHESCMVGLACHCVVGATSAYARYFYFDISAFASKHVYQCNLSGASSLLLDLNGSQFPVGAKATCHGACSHFPLTLMIDTQVMSEPFGQVILKYFVPASDIPSDVSLYCRKRSSQNLL